jgi:hypothetical protein
MENVERILMLELAVKEMQNKHNELVKQFLESQKPKE